MKRRFEFRLQRVLRVRDLEERVVRAQRAQAEGAARAAEERLEETRGGLARSRGLLRGLLASGPRPESLLVLQRALDGELGALRRRTESVRTLRIQAERMAQVHRERKSAARALEELRQRARVRHASAVTKAENQELDEIAQRRARPAGGKAEAASRSGGTPTDQAAGPPPPTDS